MIVNDIIKLLDKEENKYGGATGRERELKLSVNGEFLGSIKSAKLDGWGDGLITDVTLEVEVGSIKYLEDKIRAKAIDEFAEAIRSICYKYPIGIDADTNEPLYGHEDGTWHNLIDDVSEQMKAGGV